MKTFKGKIIKNNVDQFHNDVCNSGSYVYTTEKLSCQYANERISRVIADCYSFSGKSVLDIGCGDGTYTLQFPLLGAKKTLGIDPAPAAINIATQKAKEANLTNLVDFEVANIYTLDEQLKNRFFDCIILRGVLHHLPDPAEAIRKIASLANTIIILEPNGYNPVLKLLERFSHYHIEHEEQSFFPGTLKSWCQSAGLAISSTAYFNLVPMFCPNWMAKICRKAKPLESIPLLREIICGQHLIVAKNDSKLAIF